MWYHQSQIRTTLYGVHLSLQVTIKVTNIFLKTSIIFLYTNNKHTKNKKTKLKTQNHSNYAIENEILKLCTGSGCSKLEKTYIHGVEYSG